MVGKDERLKPPIWKWPRLASMVSEARGREPPNPTSSLAKIPCTKLFGIPNDALAVCGELLL